MSTSLIALNRFGLGARPGEPDRLDDPRGWLHAQLRGDRPPVEAPPPTSAGALADLFRAYREAARSGDREEAQRRARTLREQGGAEIEAVLTTRVRSARPFVERWVAFWSNHLCVSMAAGLRVAVLAGRYEREAIRPHVLGPFEALLLAATRHPAMLLYLDNAGSVGPRSLVGRRSGRGRRPARGLNENHARELLELHTVGVAGGYDQDDVEALARVLTGWSITGFGGPLDRGGGPPRFRFQPAMHEPGPKTVLGVRYQEAGEEEGVRVIRDLARRPETARFLATKIVRHFVADDPPPDAVERVASRWMETEGDLGEVAAATVELEAAWDPDHRKFRTPQDWLVAVLRAAGVREASPAFAQILRQLRHPLWGPAAPKGFGDTEREWADPDALMNRAELARTVADRVSGGGRGRVDPSRLATVVRLSDDDPLPSILNDRGIPVAERLALGFAGPAFQWR